MKVIYVVMGSTGQWDDHATWMVAAYDSHDKAEAHRVLAQEAGDFIYKQNERYALVEPTKYDLNYTSYGDKAHYYIQDVLMVSELTDAGLFPGVDMLSNSKVGLRARADAAAMKKSPVAGSFADKLQKALVK